MSTSASALLRERGAASWAAAVSHPMVAEIGAGSLPHETFRYYFGQNVLYLEDYARAIALIIGRAPDLAGITVLTRFLSQIVDTELPANYAFLARLGGPARSRRGDGAGHLRLHPPPARHGGAARPARRARGGAALPVELR